MKVISATVLGLALLSDVAPAFAQPYGAATMALATGATVIAGMATEATATVIAAITIGTMTEAREAGVAITPSTRRSTCAAIRMYAGRS
jgi:hypothetical protein